MAEKYRPSNGTEGSCFIEAWCFKCERDKDEDCPIVAATFTYDVDDPEYPEEWQYADKGRPICTAFVPLGDPLPRTDDRTLDLFGGGGG